MYNMFFETKGWNLKYSVIMNSLYESQHCNANSWIEVEGVRKTEIIRVMTSTKTKHHQQVDMVLDISQSQTSHFTRCLLADIKLSRWIYSCHWHITSSALDSFYSLFRSLFVMAKWNRSRNFISSECTPTRIAAWTRKVIKNLGCVSRIKSVRIFPLCFFISICRLWKTRDEPL